MGSAAAKCYKKKRIEKNNKGGLNDLESINEKEGDDSEANGIKGDEGDIETGGGTPT